MQKKTMMLVVIAILSCNLATACQVNYISSVEVTEALKNETTAWVISDSACKRMERNKLLLSISGDSGVIAGSSFAWAHLAIIRPESRVTSSAFSSSTIIDRGDASTPRAKELQRETVRNAIKSFDVDKALDEFGKITKLVK